jgi:hypothetical protein
MNRAIRRVHGQEGGLDPMDDLHELDELRALAPAPPVRPLAPERLALRKEIVMRQVLDARTSPSPPSPPSRRARPSRRWRLPVLVGAALVVLSGTAVGWAFLTSSARDTVSVQCEIRGSSTIIPSASGDPVADCAAQWQRETGSPAPALVAYDNGLGGITVLPADRTPPSGWTRLPSGATQNVSMVQMQQWLDDYVAGLHSGCYDNATAVRMTEQALPRFGMASWTVLPAPSSDLGQCVDTGILDGTNSTVALRAMSGPDSPGSTQEQLAARLRSIGATCRPLDATAAQVRAAAGELGLSEDANQFELTEVRDQSAQCTAIAENVGGTIFLILRGPAG